MSARGPEFEEMWEYVQTHEKELEPVAKAVQSGKAAVIAGAVANVFVTAQSGSPLAGTVAQALTKRCAEAFGSWFAKHDDRKVQEAANAYLGAERELESKFEFAQIMKERLDEAKAGLKLALAQRDGDAEVLNQQVMLRHEDLYGSLVACVDAHAEVQRKAERLESHDQSERTPATTKNKPFDMEDLGEMARALSEEARARESKRARVNPWASAKEKQKRVFAKEPATRTSEEKVEPKAAARVKVKEREKQRL